MTEASYLASGALQRSGTIGADTPVCSGLISTGSGDGSDTAMAVAIVTGSPELSVGD